MGTSAAKRSQPPTRAEFDRLKAEYDRLRNDVDVLGDDARQRREDLRTQFAHRADASHPRRRTARQCSTVGATPAVSQWRIGCEYSKIVTMRAVDDRPDRLQRQFRRAAERQHETLGRMVTAWQTARTLRAGAQAMCERSRMLRTDGQARRRMD